MRIRSWLMLAALAARATPVDAQAGRNVTGIVRAAVDSTPLSDVRVFVLGFPRFASSNADGRFTLFNVPARPLRVALERLGVEPDTIALGAADSVLTVYLALAPITLEAVESASPAAARQRFERVAQTSTVTLAPVDIAQTPGLAEPDVARTVQLLPGTVAKNDFYVGFSVRGGENDQNLIQLDGITVFNPSHVGGVFSTFDPAAVDEVEYLTGGFPARYGGRLSSVMEVRLRPGDRERTRGHVGASLLSAKAVLEGPIGHTGVSYVVGARRSYADLLAAPFPGDGLPYYFGDAVGKVTAPLPTGGTMEITGYWGRDVLDWPFIHDERGRQGIDLEFDWGNRLAGVTLRHGLGPLELEQSVSVSAFSTALALTPGIERTDNTARVRSARMVVGLSDGVGTSLQVGGAVDAYRMTLRERSGALGTTRVDLAYEPTVWSAYADAQVQPFWRLQLRPGLRVERVGGGRDETTVAPRIAGKIFLTHTLALTGSAGRYFQAVHSIRDQELPLTIFDFWVAADTFTPVARSEHLVAGVEQWLGEDWTITVEGYRKTFTNLVTQDFRDDPKVRGDEFIPTDGWARGVDLLVRKYGGRVSGWMAYSYGTTMRTTVSDTFPPSQDRRHTLNVVVQAPGPLGSRLGVRLGYGSPLPYTAITGQWLHREYNAELHGFDFSDTEAFSGAINGARYPYYGRLDVGLRWQVDTWGGVLQPYLQIVNVLNRRNVWVYAFDYDRAPPTRSGLSQLPFLPTIGAEFEW